MASKELTSLPMCDAIHHPIHLYSTTNNHPNLNPYLYHYGYPSLLLLVFFEHKKICWDVCVMAHDGTDQATHFRDILLYHHLTSSDIV
ncbi:hypothetical protein DEO72_LG6g973 [Vigna unguiculata]|uniref:Uncharacterized protein n=1 Tax=Vigna unguiculata TaxID=3917 RepID=A0A4D6M7A0_VIGUN|nr:hypothetical protein DEO72_LG6g973 [Vigna unguiculata]